ncbi:MAG: amino-acid N-acetyltransferase [Alysiella sp.]|uniref:amino-acid N-acetyltransferase n=1 Tax=Alysiella sp. TaxID=1872483 RepID=UPI0026DD1211|nr:amino-acid N-acetyltransferase [Alysiella sp.]MDO4434640.1 amino-acid N-acetyltransferase [Alysiella sp.]
MIHTDFASLFREAAPYIHYLRGKTLVIGLSSALFDDENLSELAADLNLIAALGIRLVVVHGIETEMAKYVAVTQQQAIFVQDHFICDAQTLQYAKQICGQIRFDFQAALSLGYTHAPQRPSRLHIASGNYLTAKPLGVIKGVDRQFSGQVRKVDSAAIIADLDRQAMVFISPVAASTVGQNYCLCMYETAQSIAAAIQAEKLIFLIEQNGIHTLSGSLLSNLSADEAQKLANELPEHYRQQRIILQTAIKALNQGVPRVQILSGSRNGGLLRELFTRDGSGTSIAQNDFMCIRQAQKHDVADMIAMIRPLAEQGILLSRNSMYLEQHIDDFVVLEHDCQIYGCMEIKTFDDAPDVAELACLVVSNQARDKGYGDRLLAYVVQHAKETGKKRLLALSTHTADWFSERGFQAATPEDLPIQRLQQYHASGRHSKIFILFL